MAPAALPRNRRGGIAWGHRGIPVALVEKRGAGGGACHHVRDAGMFRAASTGLVPRLLLHDL